MPARMWATAALLVAVVAVASVPDPAAGQADDPRCAALVDGRSITAVGVTPSTPDLASAGLGGEGWWFPQVAAPAPVEGRPTGEGARAALPPWVAPLSHFPEDPDFGARTFSQDGPARSAGGQPGWAVLTLPDGETGAAGAIVDPATAGNTNNTVNRIALQGAVPATFYLHVVVDATAGQHDPTGLLRARGNVGPDDRDEAQVEPDADPDLSFDGVPDVVTFRYDGFRAGDYLKLRLRGEPPPATGAGFSGLLFDTGFAGDTTAPAPDCGATVPVDGSPTSTEPGPGAGPGLMGDRGPAGAARPVVAAARFTG